MTPMDPVHRFQVLPLHHQVGISDLDAVEVPHWDTGQEPLIAGQQCILVATRGDQDPVQLEVWVGTPATSPPGPLLFDGQLLVTSNGIEVGDLVAGDPHQIKLPIGWHRLRIYADQPGNATRLRIVLDPTSDRTAQPTPPATTRPPA
jgi:hypothetical protein